jgi:hypothetical protein
LREVDEQLESPSVEQSLDVRATVLIGRGVNRERSRPRWIEAFRLWFGRHQVRKRCPHLAEFYVARQLLGSDCVSHSGE